MIWFWAFIEGIATGVLGNYGFLWLRRWTRKKKNFIDASATSSTITFTGQIPNTKTAQSAIKTITNVIKEADL